MSDEIRINRPSQQPVVKPEMSGAAPAPEQQGAGKSSKMPWIILAVIVILLAVAGFVFRDKLFKKGGSESAAAKSSGYQAVFLTNGQVYFGKMAKSERDYVTLNDIYYLQVGPQQGSGAASTTPSQNNISLVKLGQELHGPVDQMHISRAQILFYEDLKEDGQVVKAIIQDKNAAKK